MKTLSIGKILNFHGIQGEAKVGFSKGHEDFLKTLKKVLLKVGSEYVEKEILSVRFNKNFALIKFKDINSINELMPFKGCFIYVEKELIKENLDTEEFLVDDLIGLEVFDKNGKTLGVVTGVSNNGAHDLLAVKSKTQKVSLVPFVDELVPKIDLENKKVIVNNIEGLIE